MKSSSHLTRAVFRAIIANRPYIAPECRRQIHRSCARTSERSLRPYEQRRSIFSALLGTANRGFEGAKPTAKNLELALGRLVDLVRARRTKSRTPSNQNIIDAFRFIFVARLEAQRRLTRNEVYLTTETFKHLQEEGLVGNSENGLALTRDDLDTILSALALPSGKEKFRSDTRALASLVFEALPSSSHQPDSSHEPKPTSPVYIRVLAQTGSAKEALQLLQDSNSTIIKNDVRIWIDILKGLANEGRLPEFDTVVQELHQHLHALNATEYEELISFFALDDNVEQAKKIFDAQMLHNTEATTTELRRLVELCVRTNQLQWVEPHVVTLKESLGEEGVLGTLFVWLAAQRTSLSQLQQSMEDLLHETPEGSISMAPFNRLFEFALQNNLPEIGARAMHVAEILDLRPDGKTLSLQLKHEIQKGSIMSAASVYEQLCREDYPSDDSDLPVLNLFATTLAFSPEPDYQLLMRVVDNLLERNADFDAETLAGLCRVFLHRDELEDATGLLRHRADFYPSQDRSRISAVFRDFIMNPTIKDQRAFNAYELFRHAFPETLPEQRLPIMQSFFNRQRPDLACLVFGHMRQREDIESRPTPAAYAQCFAGIAKCRDIDGLQMVFNMLKLDLEVEPTTRIRNGLMLAYIACQMPYTAMIDHFWKIMDSAEGPTYSTFEIALRACETWVPKGGYEARKIIAIMQAWNLEITKALYDNYVGALAGQAEFESAVELIEEMENDIGERPDAITIGTFYNAIPWQYRKDEVEKWAKIAYPDLWEDLLTYGDEIDEEYEIRYFKIDRSIDIEDEPLFQRGVYEPRISKGVVDALEPPV